MGLGRKAWEMRKTEEERRTGDEGNMWRERYVEKEDWGGDRTKQY